MEQDVFIFKGITIRKDQVEKISEMKKSGEKFNLSKFTQFKLDEFFKAREETKNIIEEMKNG